MEFSRPEYEMGSLSLLQGIFPTQGLNPGLPYYRQILYQLSHKGSPRILEWAAYPFSSRPSRPYAFPVVMYGCESWTVKKAEHRRIDVFELWCRRRLLSNLKISPGYLLEGLMLKLKLQLKLKHWPPHAKSWLIGKDPDAGRDWGQEEKGTTEDKMAGCHHWLNGHESEWTPGVGNGQSNLQSMVQLSLTVRAVLTVRAGLLGSSPWPGTVPNPTWQGITWQCITGLGTSSCMLGSDSGDRIWRISLTKRIRRSW